MSAIHATSLVAARAKPSRRPRMIIAILRIAISVGCMPTPSLALGTAQERAACTADVFRLCNSEIPNVGRVIACMKAKRADLSPACRLVLDRHLGARDAWNSQPSQ